MDPFDGIVPVIATPFTASGEVDEEGLRRTVELCLDDGVGAIAAFGLAGEYYKLTEAERGRIMEVLVSQAGGRLPVLVSITPHATEAAVGEARRAERAGAAGLMVVPPFFLAPAADAAMEHVCAVARAVSLPVAVQYAPLQTGRTIEPAVLAALHRECPNVTHVKVDAVPSGRVITAIREASGGSLRATVGYMGLHLPEDAARGASGSMPTASLGLAFAHLWRLLREDEEAGRRLHAELLPLLNFMMQTVEMLIACEKALLVRRGVLAAAHARRPAWRLDAAECRELEREAERCSAWLPRLGARRG